MSITLYGLGPSRSFRCLWALEEAGLDYQFEALELSGSGEQGAKSERYLALNPQGKVPTLVHDDFVLTESAAILNYINSLAQSKDSISFIPNNAQDRARYDELSFFVLSELEQPLWSKGKHSFAIPEKHRVPEMLETAKWEFKKALSALAKLTDLSKTPNPKGGYALGKEFTFADILIAQTFNWAERFDFELPEDYLGYRDSLFARPAAIRALS